MARFQSTKLIEGFSTCFRQWKATDTHCSFLHGYAISFKVTFEGELDHRNWVADFGFMKRAVHTIDIEAPNQPASYTVGGWFNFWFDHTVILAEDDPQLHSFQSMSKDTFQLRILPSVGCEMFAKFVADNLNSFLLKETKGRVRVVQVECFEHAKNSAIYIP